MTDLIASHLDFVPICPYFTLTTAWYLSAYREKLGEPPVLEPPTPCQLKLKPERLTVQEIFGPFKEMSEDDQAQFLLLLMKHVNTDWSVACKEAAKERKIGGVAKMRDRFASIVRKHQFGLEDGRKITGGPLFKKTSLTTPKTDAPGSMKPKVDKKQKIETLNPPGKRKSGKAEPKPPTTKKVKTTTGIQNLEEQNMEEQNMEEQNMEEQNMEEQNMEEQNMEEQNMEEQNMEEQNMEEQNMEEQNMEEAIGTPVSGYSPSE